MSATNLGPQSPVFRSLVEDPELVGSALRVQAGELLFGPEHRPRHLYLVASGLFRMIDPPNGGRRLARTLAWLGPGSIIGWNVLLPRQPVRFWIRAERESRLIPLPTRMLARRIARQPRLAFELLTQFAELLHEAYVESSELIRLETPQRLANSLRRLADHPGLAQHDGRWSIIRLTHADLASRTGISRETVSLILSRWRRMGIVRTGRGRLAVEMNRLDELIAHLHERQPPAATRGPEHERERARNVTGNR
jgi:CRP-like cAMP-binding protein